MCSKNFGGSSPIILCGIAPQELDPHSCLIIDRLPIVPVIAYNPFSDVLLPSTPSIVNDTGFCAL